MVIVHLASAVLYMSISSLSVLLWPPTKQILVSACKSDGNKPDSDQIRVSKPCGRRSKKHYFLWYGSRPLSFLFPSGQLNMLLVLCVYFSLTLHKIITVLFLFSLLLCSWSRRSKFCKLRHPWKTHSSMKAELLCLQVARPKLMHFSRPMF